MRASDRTQSIAVAGLRSQHAHIIAVTTRRYVNRAGDIAGRCGAPNTAGLERLRADWIAQKRDAARVAA